MNDSIVVLASGGLDSTTLVYLVRSMGIDPIMLAIDYGQKHLRELDAANKIAETLGTEFVSVSVSMFLGGSALTDPNIDVPRNAYDKETMTLTVVPHRNITFLAIASGIAESKKAKGIAIAAHGGDHYIYPDCRPVFFDAYRNIMPLSLDTSKLFLFTPFLHSDKSNIVSLGYNLGVPFESTYSCYNGGELHCGECGTCIERKRAFEEADVADPTGYLA